MLKLLERLLKDKVATEAITFKEGEAMPYLPDGTKVTADIIKSRLGRSLHVRHLDAGSCNACDFEMGALSNPLYDLHRYGIHFDASPRHADLLMVTGVVTRNLAEALKRLPQELTDIIVLRSYDGKPLTEIAELMGLSYGAVKLRHQKALVLLRTALQTD